MWTSQGCGPSTRITLSASAVTEDRSEFITRTGSPWISPSWFSQSAGYFSRSGLETGTQLVLDSSCVPFSVCARLQMVCDLLLGRTQAELLHHHLDEDGLVLFGQDDPGEKRFHGQAATSHALFALPQVVDQPVDTVVVFESHVLFLSQTAQIVEAVLQPQFVPQIGWDDHPVRGDTWRQRQALTMFIQGRHDPVPAVRLHFNMHIEGLERFDQQVRHDLVEDDVPGFAGPWDFVDVQDFVILCVIEIEEAPQSLLLSSGQRKSLFLTDDCLPGEKPALFHPGDKVLDGFLQVPDIVQGAFFKEVVGGNVGIELPAHRGWLLGSSILLS